MIDHFTEDMLSDQQREVMARILAEPGSMIVTEGES